METKDTLPDTPSDLILAALEDFMGLLTEPDYVIDLEIWHQPAVNVFNPDEEICKVCLAGAIMAKRLGVKKHEHSSPQRFPIETSHKLCALDYFHRGEVTKGLLSMGNSGKAPYERYPIPEYDPENPHLFVEAMHQLAHELKACGL